MKTGKKVGIIGGTFNPIHIGHLILAERAYGDFDLDEILFIPTGISYFKDPATVLDSKTRITMTGEAIGENPHFALSTIETDRPGNSYTYETLEELKSHNPDTEYYLIIGADSLFQIEEWKHPESIMKNAIILVSTREDQGVEEVTKQMNALMEKYHSDIRLLSCPNIDISSTCIRERVRLGKSIHYLVADCTEQFILKHQLYKDE